MYVNSKQPNGNDFVPLREVPRIVDQSCQVVSGAHSRPFFYFHYAQIDFAPLRCARIRFGTNIAYLVSLFAFNNACRARGWG